MTSPVTWRHRVVYAAARVCLFCVNSLPERLAYGLAGGAGRLFFRCSKRRQRFAMKMLRNAYPEGCTDKELHRLGSLGTANLFKVAIDMARLIPWVNSGRLAERYDFGEMNDYPEPPFVGVTAHLGSWEVGAIATAMLRGEAHLIAREFKNPLIQRFMLSSRQRGGVIVHPKRGGMRPVVRGLAEGHLAMQAADQRQRQRGVQVPFFGEIASTDRSAAVLALRRGYPIAIAGAERIGPGFRFRGMLVDTIHVESTGDHEADVERVTAEVNRRLEQLILRRPEQYLWIHDRYRKSSDESKQRPQLTMDPRPLPQEPRGVQ